MVPPYPSALLLPSAVVGRRQPQQQPHQHTQLPRPSRRAYSASPAAAAAAATSREKRALDQQQLHGAGVAGGATKAGGTTSAAAGGGGGSSTNNSNAAIAALVAGMMAVGCGAAYYYDLIPGLGKGEEVGGGVNATNGDADAAVVAVEDKDGAVVDVAVVELETALPPPDAAVDEDGSVEATHDDAAAATTVPTDEGPSVAAAMAAVEQEEAALAGSAAGTPAAAVVVTSDESSKIMAVLHELKAKIGRDSDRALSEAHRELAKLSSLDMDQLETMTEMQLKVRLVQMAKDMEERTRWEAVRLQEFLAMKEKEVEDK